ncbi:MAG: iron(III) transport system substrate-binding protein [Actinomycetota bacterium]|nr:iron(III) transport system substrate-binding protein [Actinomycetota bacterium]
MTSASSHADLVAAAKKEGRLNVSTSFTEDSIPLMKQGFEKKYPFIKLTINEQTGDDDKRILLELQGGQSEIDVLHLSAESYTDYLPYIEKLNLLKLVENGSLEIAKDMINPAEPGTMAAGSGIGGFSYNPKLLSADKVPTSYDDFLKPQFKNRKFLIDIEPANLASLGAAWGEDKLLSYAKALKSQKPIWVRGDTNSLTQLAAGEFDLHAFSNYHSAYRVSLKSPNIKIGLLEPIPVRLTQIEAIRKGSAHPASAALFMEYTASAEAQHILDEDEPQQSSIYAPGSNLNKLTSGKEVSVMSWDKFADQATWEAAIVKVWGFPSAEVKEK